MIKKIDKNFLYTAIVLSFFGFLIFFSAAMGDLGKESVFFKNVFKQGIIIIIGFLVIYKMIKSDKINSKNLRKHSFTIFIITFLFEFLVFVPGIGRNIKGASRWINAGPIGTLQPSEFLKIGFVLLFSSLVLVYRRKLSNFKFLMLFNIFLLPIFIVFYLAKDWGTMLTIFISAFAIIFIQETVSKKHFFTMMITGIIVLGSIAYLASPHAKKRIDTFLGINSNQKVEAYQLTQGLRAVGSGKVYGRGFGKSLQKLNGSVPEPLNDSIFTIFSEEWGFLGSTTLLSIYLLLTYFGVSIVKKIKDEYAKNVIIGLLIIIIFPVLYNIGSVLNVLPFSGITLTFVSKGGSSILASLIIVGIILSLSKYRQKEKYDIY